VCRRTIENCKVIKDAVREGVGEPLTESRNGKIYCEGYQKSEYDDEPYSKCMDCRFNIFYEG